MSTPVVLRHKTAIRRQGLSVPVQCLVRDGLLTRRSLFDYGCGRGRDLELLQSMEVPCAGWDPVHRPDAPRTPAPVVNLGYVINVVEDPRERAEVLRRAWELSEILLVVSAQSLLDARAAREARSYGDGVLTSRGTFQKYYSHQELRQYLEAELGVDAVAAAPNVFYLFRREEARQEYLAGRFRRRAAAPRRRVSERLYEENQDVLEPFVQALARLGRMPGLEELPEHQTLVERFGSLKRAFLIVRRATGAEPWTEIIQRRQEDLLVYLALSRFGRKKPLSGLPLSVQRDVKAFLGTYQRAREEAGSLLFSVGNAEAIDAACRRSRYGHLVENALLVHRSVLGELEPILRVYEGCARVLLGEVEEAQVIKVHRFSGKVSYLAYSDWDTDSNPPLRLRVKVNLRSLDIGFYDYSEWPDPPRLDLDRRLLNRQE